MSNKNIIKKKDADVPIRREDVGSSLFSLQRDMNRLFDNFSRGFDLAPFEELERGTLARFTPKVNLSETDKEITVSAELLGMDEKDVAVELDDNALTIRGEKKEEHEEKGKNWHRVEHSCGSFHRVIPLPASPDAGKAKAQFKKGILTVTLPKRAEDQGKRKTIEIRTE